MTASRWRSLQSDDLIEDVLLAGNRWQHHFGVIICRHVFEGSPVRLLAFVNEQDLQFTCGVGGHWTADDFETAGLIHLLEHHPEVGSLPDMAPGQMAERSDEISPWVIGDIDDEDFEEGLNL